MDGMIMQITTLRVGGLSVSLVRRAMGDRTAKRIPGMHCTCTPGNRLIGMLL